MLDELRLRAGAEGGRDHGAGDGGGRLGAVGAAHQVEAEVDAGGCAGRGPDVVVLDEEGVRDDVDVRVVGAKEVDQVPVGDGSAAIEEAGLGEGERSAAEGGEGGAAGVGAAEGVEDGGRCGGEVVVEAGDDDQVGAGEPGEGPVGKEGETAAHRNRSGGVGGDAAQFEGGYAAVGAVRTPDLGDDGDVEGTDAGEGDQGNAACLLHAWQ